MERIEYRGIIDKSEWGHGPWTDEPDKVQWQDEATGLPCLIVRGQFGALCGYVGVAPGHPLHGKGYDDCDVDVHGGLTFAHGCAEISREKWLVWREHILAPRDEAKQYPIGDAANALKEWAKELDDYDAWARSAAARYICHVAEPGEPDPVWWFGFDCAHAWDICPSSHRRYRGGYGDVYRNIAYVESECRSLAMQLIGGAQ